jgi:hypothetical protein
VPGKTTITNDNGEFLINGLTPGWYYVMPGYLEGDGYENLNYYYNEDLYEITAGTTTNTGNIVVLKGMSAISPQNGATINSRRPVFTWTNVPEADAYELQWAVNSYLMSVIIEDLTTNRYEVPPENELPSNCFVRWSVWALADIPEEEYMITIAQFENTATFTVSAETE